MKGFLRVGLLLLCSLQLAWATPLEDLFDKMVVTPKADWDSLLAPAALQKSDLGAEWKHILVLAKAGEVDKAIALSKALDYAGASLNADKSYQGLGQIGLALYLNRQSNIPPALKMISELRAEHPELADAYVVEGLLTASKNPADALVLMEQARKFPLDKEMAEMNFMGIGQVQMRLGHKSEAIAAFQEALKINPGNGMARDVVSGLQGSSSAPSKNASPAQQAFDKAEAAFSAGDYQAAVKLYDQVIALDAKFAKAYVYKGDAYLQMGQLDLAINCYRQALGIDPRDKQAHRFLGDVLMRKFETTGDRPLLEEAVRCFEAAVKIDPNYQAAQDNLIEAKARLNK